LAEEVVFYYRCDNFYVPPTEYALTWDDSELKIDWRILAENVILSEKVEYILI
jgi:hypothetical protein